MMNTKEKQQPVRPPRMTRAMSKESSAGLLMSVIRSLTASRDTQERDHEKAKVQQEFRESDIRLDKLVLEHHQDLTSVMQAFSKISIRLDSARRKLQGVREKMISCQNLLNCKRDELKRLWLDSMENKYVLELLDHVEDQMKASEKVTLFVESKHYLHATKLMLSSLAILNGELKHIDGLTEIRSELKTKKEEMFNLLIDDLHKHIYTKPTIEVIQNFKRQDIERKVIIPSSTDLRSVSVAEILSSAVLRPPAIRQTCSPSPSNEPVTEDLDISDPEADSKHFIGILIECLALLNKIPETITLIKERADKELGNIVKRTGRELFDGTMLTNPKARMINVSGQNIPDHLLQEFIDCLLTQFRSVADIHENIVLVHLKKASAPESAETYTMSEIWTKIQSVVEVVADYYSNVSNSKTIERNSPSSQESEINNYFVKRKPEIVTGEKPRMFRFDLSSPALIFNAYLEEQQT